MEHLCSIKFFCVSQKQCNEDYTCSSALSKSTSRQIYSAAKRPTEHVSAGTHITHVPCPCHCADAIVPVHQAHQIMPATSCPCNCSHRLTKKYVRWRSCRQSMYPPEKHITTCAVPVPSCRCHRYCAIVPVESRLCHRALQLFSCTWLCRRACANVPVPGPSCLGHRARSIVPVPSFHRAIVSVPVPSLPCHCSITSDTQAVNIASVTYPLMVKCPAGAATASTSGL
jgi:hypothetical protein